MPVAPCPATCPPPTLGIVQFDNTEFIGLYPEFTGISSGLNQQAFNIATLFLNNTCGSFVQDANQRMALLYILTAHIDFLNNGTNDGAGNVNPAPGIVGRIDSATEGSVSVSASYSSEVSQSEAFYIQTKYGAQYWEATAWTRTALAVPAPAFGPNGPGFPWLGDGFWGDF